MISRHTELSMQNNVAEKEETQEIEVVEVEETEAPENVSRETS